MSAFDDSMVNRAAPPGSMRYFSVLYAPVQKRDAVMALYIIDAEIRESAQSANHDVAHTRLQWWRQEIDRLVNGHPQHPATRVLGSSDRGQFAKLHELVAAADMDLARMTYLNMRELRAYCARSGGAVQELIAAQLAAPLGEPGRAAANRIGVGIRQTEILRDLRQDAYHGRLYLPLEELDRRQIGHQRLREPQIDPALKEILSAFRSSVASELKDARAAMPPELRPSLRPLSVLADLHLRLLDRIARRDYDVASERVELGPLEKSFGAWRAARRS
jgi:phytoene synthase